MDPIDFLFSLERLGMKFGLENMNALCGALGHPERAFRSVHIAGTNGKGSVTAMVEDPTYLTQPFVRTYQFKKVADAAGWEPTPCWNR